MLTGSPLPRFERQIARIRKSTGLRRGPSWAHPHVLAKVLPVFGWCKSSMVIFDPPWGQNFARLLTRLVVFAAVPCATAPQLGRPRSFYLVLLSLVTHIP